MTVQERLEYLRGQIEAERISYGELAELQDYGARGLIAESDVVLREWAGLPEFPEEENTEMKLYTASVDSEDINEGEWNDLLSIAARGEDEARDLAARWVRNARETNTISEVEVYEYKGDAKVLASYYPDEEHD